MQSEKTLADLEKALGRKLDKRDTVGTWRRGYLFMWSPVAKLFVDLNEPSETIRPGESAHLNRHGKLLAIYDI